MRCYFEELSWMIHISKWKIKIVISLPFGLGLIELENICTIQNYLEENF
jgi:hypothetical protein